MTRLAVLWLAALPGLAAAQGFSYSYVQGSVISSELNVGPLDADGDGIGVTGSVRLLPRYHLFASFDDQGFDFDIDSTTLEVGAGYNYSLHEDFDFVGRLAYVETDIDRPGPDRNEEGFSIEGGVRGRFTERVEFDAGLRYVDLDRSDTLLFFHGRYLLRPNLAAGGGLTSDDGDLTLTATIRFIFGGSVPP